MRGWKNLLMTTGILAAVMTIAAELPQSGQALPVGIGDGCCGPLAVPESYKSFPIGAGDVYGGERPDLFLCAPVGVERAVYLYRYLRTAASGQPVFGEPVKVKGPWTQAASAATGRMFMANGALQLVYLEGTEKDRSLCISRFDRERKVFEPRRKWRLRGAGLRARSVVYAGEQDGKWHFYLAVSAPPSRPVAVRTPEDQSSLYDGAGIYQGNWPRFGIWMTTVDPGGGTAADPVLLSAKEDAMLGIGALTVWPDESGRDQALAANSLGAVYAISADGRRVGRAWCGKGVLRHVTQGAQPLRYPGVGSWSDALIVGGEGALYLYPAESETGVDGGPVFAAPVPVLEEQAKLFAGTLAVPVLYDWDGDGVTDMLAGNSEGRVLFFKNHGSSREPAFAPGIELSAGGVPIHIQPGYYGVQGPFETRWGYTCPAVADWNGDGLPDLLLSDATARYRVYLNIGTRTRPVLAAERLLKLDGLELHGTWRVKPGVAKLDGRMALVILDDDNDFHLYWKLDDENVTDGGKLRWQDGQIMKAYALGNLRPGQRGRGKISLVDYDGDGRVDILFGSMRRACLPGPEIGLPWTRFRRGESGMQLLWLRNMGTNAEPVFARPEQFQFRGHDRYFGSHTSAGDAGELGDTAAGTNVILGVESGRIYFFDRRDLTFAPTPWSREAEVENKKP